jgi:hypothetical protein
MNRPARKDAVSARELNVAGRCGPALLDEGMQQHELASLADKEEHPGDPVTRQRRTDLMQAVAHRPHHRHADRPAEFDLSHVVADNLAFFGREQLEPIANRLVTRRRSKEDRWRTLEDGHDSTVPYAVQSRSLLWRTSPFSVVGSDWDATECMDSIACDMPACGMS